MRKTPRLRAGAFPLASLGIGLLLAITPGCRRVLRYPAATPLPPAETDRLLAREMNPLILTNLVARELVVEVDWVEGCEPSPMALAGLEAVAREHCPPGKQIRVLPDDAIPRKLWEDCPDGDSSALATEFIDRIPDLEAGLDTVYMLYLPRKSSTDSAAFGERGGWTVERDGRTVRVGGMILYKDAIRSRAALWVTADRLDRSTLVHEFGHLLGLVANPAHNQSRLPGHCSNPDCVMTQPQWRSILYSATAGFLGANLPRDYCRDCRADIARARGLWEERAAGDSSFVLELRRGQAD